MLEIIFCISLLTQTEIPIENEFQYKDSVYEFRNPNQNQLILNNSPTDNTLDLVLGTNQLTILDKENQLINHLTIITNDKIDQKKELSEENSQTVNAATNPKEQETNTESEKPESLYMPKKGDLIITKLLPNSENETLTIKNTSTQTIKLDRLHIGDKTTKKHELSGEIKAQEEITIENLKIVLNNSNETVYIKNNQDEIIYEFSYKESKPEEIIYTKLVNLNSEIQDYNTDSTQNTEKEDLSPPKAIEIESPETTIQEVSENQQILSHTTNSDQNQSQLDENFKQDINLENLVISEVHPNPIGDEKTNEFIELYNPNNIDIKTSSYRLTIKNKEVKLPETIQAMSYIFLDKISLANTGSEILLEKNGIKIQEITYLDSIEGQSIVVIGNQRYNTNLISKGSSNGIIKSYKGAATVNKNQIQTDENQIINQNHIKLADSEYQNIEILYLEKNNQRELQKIIENTAIQKAINDSHTNNELENNTNQQDITSVGLLSMASLGVIYTLFK